MKTLLLTAVFVLITGCTSPFRQVSIPASQGYYIEESAQQGIYRTSGSVLFADAGFYPWWVNVYPPPIFPYYSPYDYPFYFSIWNPPGFQPYFGHFGGYYSYWCPPHRIPPQQGPFRHNDIPGLTSPPSVSGHDVAERRDLWRSGKGGHQARFNGGDRNGVHHAGIPAQPTTLVGDVSSNSSFVRPRSAPGFSAGSFGPSPRPQTATSSARMSSGSVIRHKQ